MSDIDWSCPDCMVPTRWNDRGQVSQVRWQACGLTHQEHRRVAKARTEAKKKAHELMVQHRIEEQLPTSIINEIYDEAERRVRSR